MIGKCPVRTCGGNELLCLDTDFPEELLGVYEKLEPEHPYRWKIGNPDPRERTQLPFCPECHKELVQVFLMRRLIAGADLGERF